MPQEVGFGTSAYFLLLLPGVKLKHYSRKLITCIFTVYRLNTYPLIHINFLDALFGAIAVTPLMERFETEHGTLLTGAMFVGRMCS